MCSPGLTQPNNAPQQAGGPIGFTPTPGSGYHGFNPPTVDTSGGMISGQMPTQIKTPMGTVNNVHAIGKLSNNPFTSNQGVVSGLQSGLGSFNAAKFIK